MAVNGNWFYTARRRVLRWLRPIPGSYGAVFAAQHEFLRRSQWQSPEELQAYQAQQLNGLITHCYKNVPYYRDLFESLGLTPEDFRSVADLAQLPLLSKETVRDNVERLVATNIPLSNREFCTTGGTTGAPLGLWIDKRATSLRLAYDWRFYGWAGLRFYDRQAFLRGRSISRLPAGQCWKFDPYHNGLFFSSFDLSESNMALYLGKMREFRPQVLHGYPSALEVLASFVLDNNLETNEHGDLQAIITGSETITALQRRRISLAFKAPVFDTYGNTEQAARFGECSAHQGYHEYSEHGITEIVNPDADGVGEIVATSFVNYAMPLLRYRIGDNARRSKKRCTCGRGLPVIDLLLGRSHDYAVLKDGTLLPAVALHSCLHGPELEQLRQFQLLQEEAGRLKVLVVKGKHYSEGSCEPVFRRMNANLAVPLEISITFVNVIPRTAEGKHRFFVQKIHARCVEAEAPA